MELHSYVGVGLVASRHFGGIELSSECAGRIYMEMIKFNWTRANVDIKPR